MLRKIQRVGIIVAGLLLAACGGGGDGGQASIDVGARLASAKFASVDASKCEKAGSAYHLEAGQCIARFPGIDVKPPATQALAAAKRGEGESPLAAQVPYTVPTMSALFNWASGAYPSIFYGGYQDGSIYMPGFGTFSYRYFYSGNYLAVLGDGVYAYGWATDYTIYYVGTLSDFSCYVYSCGGGGGGGGSGSTLAVGSSVSSGFYSSGGYTDHSVYLYAGTSYTFNLVGGSLGDPYLQLYDPYSGLAAYDDDNGDGLNSRIVHTAAYSGYYTLRAKSYGSGYGSYTLSAAYTSGSGGGGGGGSGSSLSVGSYVSSGFYSSGGYTDHSIYLYSGTSYTFSLVGSSLGDPYLQLYDPYGSLAAYDDDSGDGLNALITYSPNYTGYHTLRAKSYGTGYGSYTLSAAYASSGGGGGGGGGGGSGSYITWTNSSNGVTVVDANNEYFAFDSSSRCLYSYNTGGTTSNFCLYAGSSSGNFAGQSVQVLLVAATGGGCIAALADPYGYQIDIYTNGGVQTVTTTNSQYNTSGCTY